MFQHQKAVLQEQLKELQHTIDIVNYKCWYYETAKAAGTTDVPQNMPETDIPAAFQKIRQELKQIPQAKPLQNENQEWYIMECNEMRYDMRNTSAEEHENGKRLTEQLF